MPKINVLEKNVAELIAAGEVIDRPASVVKELVENSIDAGATSITVEIQNGGVQYIRITDNGCGISSEDVPIAFLRHATSKVKNEHDLDHIATLGFRGEALASVCAVAKVELFTKTSEASFGTRIVLEGGEQTVLEEAGCPQGTTIVVRELFYNVPARLKFLKRDVSEANAVASVLDKIALSHPQISFKFIRDHTVQIHTPGDGKLYSAIYSIFGAKFAETMTKVNYTFGAMKVTGYTSIPMSSRANRTMQHFFVNGRYVKSRTCAVALEEGYKSSIMTGKFPACILNLEIPYSEVDVNVHPSKIEVRFVNERSVFDCIYFAVKTAIAADSKLGGDTAQSSFSSFSAGEAFVPSSGEQLPFSSSIKTKTEIEPEPYLYKPTTGGSQRMMHDTVPSVMPRIFLEKPVDSGVVKPAALLHTESSLADADHNLLEASVSAAEIKTSLEDSAENTTSVSNRSELKLGDVKVIGELFKTYVLAEIGDDFIMLDKHAAHERILYEQLKASEKDLDRQVLLSPATVVFSKEEYDALLQNQDIVNHFGFTIEDFGNSMILIREIPSILDQFDASQLLSEIALNIRQLKRNASPQVLEDLYHSVACKAAIKAHDNNNLLELISLIERVYTDESIRYCPHGRPVIKVISKSKIEKQFGRQV